MVMYPLTNVIDAVACITMMACLAPVANIMSPRRHPWYTLLLVSVVIVLMFNVVIKISDDFSQISSWTTAILHSIWAVALVITRKRAWLFIRIELGQDSDTYEHPYRRVTDVKPFLTGK